MTRQLFISTIFLAMTALNVHGQTINSLITDFKQDSLGCKGLRAKHTTDTSYYIKNKKVSEILFDRKSIKGKTKQQVIDLLGSPNYSSNKKTKKKNIVYFNYYNNTCGNKKPGTTILIVFTNDIVSSTGLVIHD